MKTIQEYYLEILEFMWDPQFNLDTYFKIRNIDGKKEHLIREKVEAFFHNQRTIKEEILLTKANQNAIIKI